MRIWHIIKSLDPAEGGPPVMASRLAAAQATLGHTVTIGSYDPGGAREMMNQSLKTIPGIQSVQFAEYPAPAGLNRFTAGDAMKDLRGHLASCDFLHLHGVWEPLLLRASWLARKNGVPYTITPHGMLDPWSLKQHALKKRIALTIAYRSMLRHVSFLHLLNQDEQELIGPLALKCPGVVIPNGVFLEEIEPLPSPGGFYAKHPELKNQPYILFMSRLHYKKGLDYLSDAFAKLAQNDTNTRLVVAGPDGGATEDFRQHIQAHGLGDRTHLVGPIYGQDKIQMLADASCFCLPSRQEGFSMAITEALACGVPCVISEPCHFPEVGRANAGRVVPLDAEKVGDALIEVMNDASLRETMSNNARELVKQRYTWPAIAQQAVETYQRYISGR